MYLNKNDQLIADAIPDNREIAIKKYIGEKVLKGSWYLPELKSLLKNFDELNYLRNSVHLLLNNNEDLYLFVQNVNRVNKDDIVTVVARENCRRFISETSKVYAEQVNEATNYLTAVKNNLKPAGEAPFSLKGLKQNGPAL